MDGMVSNILLEKQNKEKRSARATEMTAREELAAVPHILPITLVREQEKEDRKKGRLVRSSSSAAQQQQPSNIKGKLHEFHAHGIGDTTGSTAAIHSHPVLVPIKSYVPIGGKTAFTISHFMTDPLSVLKQKIITTHGMPSGELTLHVDADKQLPDDVSFVDLGIHFAPLVTIRGFKHEFFICNVGVDMKSAVGWHPHLTATDLVKECFRRFKPYDLRMMRISTLKPVINVANSADGNGNDNGGGAVKSEDSFCAFSTPQAHPLKSPTDARLEPGHVCVGGVLYQKDKEIPLKGSYSYKQTSAVEWDATFISMHLAYHDDDPCSCIVRRSKDGEMIDFDFSGFCRGRTSMAELRDAVLDVELQGELDRYLVNVNDHNAEVVASECPFDDDDEEVAPAGAKKLYFLAGDKFPVFSFTPPVEDSKIQYHPKFIPIDDNYMVPHLSDFGVYPSSCVLVEYYNPHIQSWSCDLAAELELERGGGVRSHTDLLTIKGERGQVVRVPATPHSEMSTLLTRFWCVTGDIPMFTVLQSDSGRILGERETIVGVQLLPQSTVHAVHRPRPWYGESHVLQLPHTAGTSLLSLREPDFTKPDAY